MRFIWPLLFVLVAGCMPAMQPTHQRQGDEVVVSITANRPVFEVSLTITDARSDDERCVFMDPDTWCLIGDLDAGEVATVTATGPFGVGCIAAGYVSSGRELHSYRPFACRAQPSG